MNDFSKKDIDWTLHERPCGLASINQLVEEYYIRQWQSLPFSTSYEIPEAKLIATDSVPNLCGTYNSSYMYNNLVSIDNTSLYNRYAFEKHFCDWLRINKKGFQAGDVNSFMKLFREYKSGSTSCNSDNNFDAKKRKEERERFEQNGHAVLDSICTYISRFDFEENHNRILSKYIDAGYEPLGHILYDSLKDDIYDMCYDWNMRLNIDKLCFDDDKVHRIQVCVIKQDNPLYKSIEKIEDSHFLSIDYYAFGHSVVKYGTTYDTKQIFDYYGRIKTEDEIISDYLIAKKKDLLLPDVIDADVDYGW